MRKGVSYIIVLVLIAAALFLLYSSGPRFTGFAVFEQTDNASFFGTGNYASYENITWNGTAMILDVNQTSGIYISKIFDANETGELGENDSVEWNNLTWQGTGITFEGRSCDSADCANVSFEGADLSALNLSKQYFQYKALFTFDPNSTVSLESVVIDYSLLASEPEPEPLAVTISEPSGTKDIDSGIPIEYTITGGENVSLSCLYNLKYASDDTIVIVNTTLTDCGSSSFDVPNEGDYILNLYVSSAEEFAYDDSSFSVSLPTETEEISETEEEEEGAGEGESSVQVPAIPSFELIATEPSALSMVSGGSQEVIWSISNTGRNPVSMCSVKPLGDYASWIVTSEDTLNINSGETGDFAFSVLAPEETEEGSYLLSVSVECAETAVSKDFSLEVSGVSEETGEGEGAPVGGFAIFAGIGAGEAIIFIVVLFVLVFVFVFARRMRKQGKTLKDIFSRFRRQQQ